MVYVIYKDARGEWRWYIQASNGNKIANSGEGYINKADCERAITLVKGSSNAPVRQQ